jgi:hypothetical protein
MRMVEKEHDFRMLGLKIRELRKTAEEIRELGHEIEAVERNANRILASTRMLEINVNDVLEVL